MQKHITILWMIVSLFANQQLKAQTPLQFRDSSSNIPQTFAMIMGVSNYKYIRPLQYADKDAELFRDYLRSPGGGSVSADNIFCLLNENAINANFWTKGFQWLRAKGLRKGDRLFIYLAGHGDAIDEDQFFFLSYDCNPAGDKNNYLVGGTIQLFNLKKKIAAETAKGVDVFFIMDACRSNELPGGVPGQNFLNTAISEKRAGEIIMLATGAGQASLEDASIGSGHGLFTYYLVDGLNGMADKQTASDQKITFAEIEEYVRNNVPSVAEQKFKRKQEPYFCCNDKNDKIISSVDTAWLRDWLQKKRVSSGGNSFHNSGFSRFKKQFADTTLPATYNLFNQAIRDNRLTGTSSAEDYYNQLLKKFPGNPHTLDAKTSLAAAFIKEAQAKVNDYLACSQLSKEEKEGMYRAGLQLEKAISLVKDEDPDYAQSLESRMHLLKTNGSPPAFQNAYAALRIDPAGAYILNRIALLHLEADNRDSALYYASKATATAPQWNCAITTLATIQQYLRNTPDNKGKPTGKTTLPKNSFGIMAGAGVSISQPEYSGNQANNIIGTDSKAAASFQVGLLYMINLSRKFSIRPATALHFENVSMRYRQRALPGGEIITVTATTETVGYGLSVPLLFRLSGNSTTPYLLAGASFSYLIGQKSSTADVLQLKKSMLATDFGLGTDIALPKARIILSPELKYSLGLTDINDTRSGNLATALSGFKKSNFAFTVYLRKK